MEAHLCGKNVDILFGHIQVERVVSSKDGRAQFGGDKRTQKGHTRDFNDTYSVSCLKKKNWKQTLLKLSPLSRWQMDVCYFSLYTVCSFEISHYRRERWNECLWHMERSDSEGGRERKGGQWWSVQERRKCPSLEGSEARGWPSLSGAPCLGAEEPSSCKALLVSSLTSSPPWPAHQEPIYRAEFKYKCDLALIIYFSQLERVHFTQSLTRHGKGALCHSAR